jgi:hypothetical protein
VAGHPAQSRLALIMDLRKEYTSVMAGVQSGDHVLPQDRLAALAAQNPTWRKIHQSELDAAVATFPCSQTTDRIYVSIFSQHLNRNG